MNVPVFIICRDRLTPLQRLIGWLERAGLRALYLLDNDSRYPPLLSFYRSCNHRVIHLGRNVGRLCLFAMPELREHIRRRPFIYTDPDIVPDEGCPLDAVELFSSLLTKYPNVAKVGFGLRIDDIPSSYRHRDAAIRWERQFWEAEVEPGVYAAPIDTTFALYRAGQDSFSFDALRTGAPYVAQHLTWYVDEAHLTDEELFYRHRVATETDESPSTSHWSAHELSNAFIEATQAEREVGPQNDSLSRGMRRGALIRTGHRLLDVVRDVALAVTVRAFVKRGADWPGYVQFMRDHPARGNRAITLNQVESEIRELCDLLRHQRPQVVVEIGTAGGGSLFLFCETAAENATLISVDLPPPKGYRRSQSLVYRAFARPGQRVVPLRGDSHDEDTLSRVRRRLRGREVDFLFIDGDHSGSGVALDYRLYGPLVRDGGIVAIHDVVPGHPDWVGDVPDFWRSLAAHGGDGTSEIVENWSQGGWGIGVLRVGPGRELLDTATDGP